MTNKKEITIFEKPTKMQWDSFNSVFSYMLFGVNAEVRAEFRELVKAILEAYPELKVENW